MCIIYWGGLYFGKPHGTMYSCVDVGAVSADMRVPQGTLPGICHTHRAAACRPRNKIQSDPQNVAHYLEHPVFLDTVSWMATAVVVVVLLLLTIIILFFSFLFFSFLFFSFLSFFFFFFVFVLFVFSSLFALPKPIKWPKMHLLDFPSHTGT